MGYLMNVEFNGNVLVVEDNPVNQIVIRSQLKKMGIDVDVAGNGQEALDIFGKDKTYNLIFMDLQMPVMGGIECTENIRLDDQVVPIVAVTANVTDIDRQNCKDCGMNGFIPKPLQRDFLISELDKWLERK